MNSLPICYDDWTDDWSDFVCNELGLGAPNPPVNSTVSGKYVSVKGMSPKNYYNIPRIKSAACKNGAVHMTCGEAKKCGFRSRTFARNFIVGGQLAPPNAVPWHVALLTLYKFTCGASIIAPKLIITAAHCVTTNALAHKIRVGSDRTNTDVATLYEVAQIFIHPRFNDPDFSNDIALLVLARNITYTDSVHSICLPDENDDFVHEYCLTSGWGVTTPNRRGSSPPKQLLIKRVQIMPPWECRTIRPVVFNTTTMLCEGDDDYFQSPCSGDSGSSHFCTRKHTQDQYYLAGVTSYGRWKCGHHHVSTRVSAFVGWIREVIDGLNVPTP